MIGVLTSFIFLSTTIHVAQTAAVRHDFSLNITTSSKATAATYKLVDKFAGESFFDGWNFWDQSDPTHGQVNYLSRSDATAKNLTYVQSDGTAVLAVDDYTWLNDGEKRNSVRVQSKKTYNGGLFILDAWSELHFLCPSKANR
jgi:hypothetical protein